MAASEVTAAGFTTAVPRAGTIGEGDGNGIFIGIASGGGTSYAFQCGEPTWFWVDLSANTKLIDGNFNSVTATPTVGGASQCAFAGITGYIALSKVMPIAKIGQGNYVTVFSVNANERLFILSNISYFGGSGNPINSTTSLGLSPNQAYAIDSKIDDGLPQSGRVTARYTNWVAGMTNRLAWASGGGVEGASTGGAGHAATTAATPASDTTCYDNGNVVGTQKYSVGTNGGNGLNCALSFKFQ